jgi:hypothetical protein
MATLVGELSKLSIGANDCGFDKLDGDTFTILAHYLGLSSTLALAQTTHGMQERLSDKETSLWAAVFQAEFGVSVSDGATALETTAPPFKLCELAFRQRLILGQLIQVARGDISSPPPTPLGTPFDGVVIPTHPGLLDSGLPSAQHSVHTKAGPQLRAYIIKMFNDNSQFSEVLACE